MKIEAVTVCINYGDFLAETVPVNVGLLDHWTVITAPDDHETREVCRRYNIKTLLTEDGHRKSGADSFAKGRLIERALQHSSKEGWRLHT